jgi:hypothetical protein
MKYKVNDSIIQYETTGLRAYGEHIVLLDGSIDLTKNCPWADDGFSLEQLFEDSFQREFQSASHSLLLKLWREAGLVVADDFDLDQYHLKVASWEDHLKMVDKTKLLSTSDFPIDIKLLEQRISSICGEDLMVKNPFDDQSVFHFRVIRPNSNDNNPLHRDVWLADYKDCINLYIPIAGSNGLSSLTIIPGSHRWPESRLERTAEGALINNVRFNVPAVTSIVGDYNVVRPNPTQNQVLLFSPYLVHGGASNLNQNQTRISIEVRLWKR